LNPESVNAYNDGKTEAIVYESGQGTRENFEALTCAIFTTCTAWFFGWYNCLPSRFDQFRI